MNSVSLNFSIIHAAEWIGYSLDEKAPVDINGNITLIGLSNGYQTVKICANDTYGNAATSQILAFTVNVPAPFSIIEASAVINIAIAIIGATIVLLKKQKLV
jgi:hypothetical protein